MTKRYLQYMRVPVTVPSDWQVVAFLVVVGTAMSCLAVAVAIVCFR
jgi:hypothetical protein